MRQGLNSTHRMFRAMATLLALSGFVILTGQAIAGNKLPGWVTAPPPDTPEHVFGVGEGSNLATSRSSALAAIAGKLKTIVESSVEVKQEQQGADFMESVLASVDAQVNDTKLSHYEVAEVAEARGTFFTLVKLSRRDFVNENKRQLDALDTTLSNRVSRAKSESILNRYLTSAETFVQIDEAKAKVELLRTLDPSFDGGEHMQRYLAYADALSKALAQLTIYIKSDEPASQFARELSNQLTQKKIRSSLTKPAMMHSTILIRSAVEEQESFGAKAVALSITLTTVDETGFQFADVQRSETGTSMSNPKMALQLASKKHSKKCQDAGVLNYLGIAQN